MGWEIGDAGFRVVLSADVPARRGAAFGRTSTSSSRSTASRSPTSACSCATRAGPRSSRRSRSALALPRERARALVGAPRARWATSRAPRCCSCSATRSPSRPPPGTLRPAARDGPGLLLRSWCCSDGDVVARFSRAARGRGERLFELRLSRRNARARSRGRHRGRPDALPAGCVRCTAASSRPARSRSLLLDAPVRAGARARRCSRSRSAPRRCATGPSRRSASAGTCA